MMGDTIDDQIAGLLYAGDDGEGIPRYNRTCKYCGVTGLGWEMTEHGWRLFSEEGDVHLCRKPGDVQA